MRPLRDVGPLRLALVGTLAVTLVRLALLPLYQTALGPDEAQYWFWGQTLDWGYYSKPPVIAWVIALPTALFGDHAWSARLLSPVLIGAAGLFLFGAARRLYDDRAALWTLVLWHLTPAVMLGATIVSTDVPLLLCWSAALYALVRMTEGASRYALLLGAALGFGLLSKYAMIYWLVGLALAAALSPRARRAGTLPIFGAVALGVLVFAPNILWNIANGMQTVGHTADNADWRGGLQWSELTQFLGDQLGVAGPVVFLALLGALFAAFRRRRDPDVLLASFVLPPLLVISAQALLSRANANWAMTAYPAALILVPAMLLRWRAAWALWSSAALHGLVGLVFTAALLNFGVADALGLSNAVKRLRGWDETAAQVLEAFAASNADAVLLDDRELAAHLVWELRDDSLPIMVLDPDGRPDNTYELSMPFRPCTYARALLVTPLTELTAAHDAAGTRTRLPDLFVDLHAERRGRRERTLEVYLVEAPCPAD